MGVGLWEPINCKFGSRAMVEEGKKILRHQEKTEGQHHIRNLGALSNNGKHKRGIHMKILLVCCKPDFKRKNNALNN